MWVFPVESYDVFPEWPAGFGRGVGAHLAGSPVGSWKRLNFPVLGELSYKRPYLVYAYALIVARVTFPTPKSVVFY